MGRKLTKTDSAEAFAANRDTSGRGNINAYKQSAGSRSPPGLLDLNVDEAKYTQQLFDDALEIAFGLAYGAEFPRSISRRVAGFDGIQSYVELYYRIAAIGGGSIPNLMVSPDLQVVANSSGNRIVDPIAVYGSRVQASF